MDDDPLTTYIKFATVLVRRDRLIQHSIREQTRMTTPAAIDRATAHAERVKKLMAQTETVNTKAGPVLDKYEAALARFAGGISDIDAKSKDLEAQLSAMGNASGILGDAFREDPKDEKAPAVETQEVKPEDVGDAKVVVDGEAPKKATGGGSHRMPNLGQQFKTDGSQPLR